MKSKSDPVLELTDLVLIPTSFLRLAHTNINNGKWAPLEEYKNSKFARALPYVGACGYELGRGYIYYLIAEALLSK